jgi:SRSO17 transposase
MAGLVPATSLNRTESERRGIILQVVDIKAIHAISLEEREMALAAAKKSGSRFRKYIDALVSIIGHADRERPLRDYCVGLLLPSERKSVEPIAAMTAPSRLAAQHQSLLHFVNNAPWSDEAVLAKICEQVLPAIERHGPIEAWIIDDTSFRKHGCHSVGVARQYCGAVGKTDNCQVAVSLSIANHGASLPIAYRLYLPREWAADADRRRKAGVPATIKFASKLEIALGQIRAACAAGIPRGVVLMDHFYGASADLRASISALALSYVASINPQTSVWAPDTTPLPPKPWSGRGGRPSRRQRRDADHKPMSVKELAFRLPKRAWRTVRWREGSADWLSSRFARVRVRPARGDDRMAERRPEEWLLIEWPRGESEPTNYWLSNLPADITFERLVDFAKLRWRIERDYQELKQEVGLAHFEGRGWRGFHHHATMCIAAYGFLISERETIPPSAPRTATKRSTSLLPKGYRPRGAPDPSRTPRSKLDRDHAASPHSRSRQQPIAMSLL